MKKEIFTTLAIVVLATGVIALPPMIMDASASGGSEKREYNLKRDNDDGYKYEKMETGAAMPVDQVIASLKKQGYKEIHEIERKRHAYEVKAINADGKRVKFYVNRSTGKVLN